MPDRSATSAPSAVPKPGHAVRTAAHGEVQPLLRGGTDDRDDVVLGRAPDDGGRPDVDHRVVDPPGLLVALVPGTITGPLTRDRRDSIVCDMWVPFARRADHPDAPSQAVRHGLTPIAGKRTRGRTPPGVPRFTVGPGQTARRRAVGAVDQRRDQHGFRPDPIRPAHRERQQPVHLPPTRGHPHRPADRSVCVDHHRCVGPVVRVDPDDLHCTLLPLAPIRNPRWTVPVGVPTPLLSRTAVDATGRQFVHRPARQALRESTRQRHGMVGSGGFSSTHSTLILVAYALSLAFMIWLVVVARRMQDSEVRRLTA